MEKLKWGVLIIDYCCILVIKFGVFNYIIFFSCIKLEEKKWDLYNLKKKINYFYVRIEEK